MPDPRPGYSRPSTTWPWARLVPLEQGEPRRQPGLLKGQLLLPAPGDLLAPLPFEELDAIEQGSALF